jgi:putative transposase
MELVRGADFALAQMLRREGHLVNKKLVQRLYREERLMVRRRDGRKRAKICEKPMRVRTVFSGSMSLTHCFCW